MRININSDVDGLEMIANKLALNADHKGYFGLVVFPRIIIKDLFMNDIVSLLLTRGGKFIREKNRVELDNGAIILFRTIQDSVDVHQLAGHQFQDIVVFNPMAYPGYLIELLRVYNRCSKDFQPMWMEVVL